MAPWTGTLRIAPSLVAGVEIDSAGWKTDAHTVDLGSEVILILATRLRVSRDIDIDSLAMIYLGTGPRSDPAALIADPELNAPIYSDPGFAGAIEERDNIGLRAGTVLRTERIFHLNGGWIPLTRVCPASVQLLPRQQLALHLYPGRFSSGHTPAASLTVSWDSTVDPGFGSPMIIGVVRNASDTVVRGAVAALIVKKRKARPGESSTVRLGASPDTLEYALGPAPAGGTVGFSGGFFEWRDSIVERLVYPATAIRERPIATERDRHRVSWVRSR